MKKYVQTNKIMKKFNVQKDYGEAENRKQNREMRSSQRDLKTDHDDLQ